MVADPRNHHYIRDGSADCPNPRHEAPMMSVDFLSAEWR